MKYFWLTIKKMFRFLLKPLSFVPALCVMYMIFSFSAQTADESGQLSMLVSEKVVLLLGKLTSGISIPRRWECMQMRSIFS